MYLFMDESGCLGFDFNKENKYFIDLSFHHLKGRWRKLLKRFIAACVRDCVNIQACFIAIRKDRRRVNIF